MNRYLTWILTAAALAGCLLAGQQLGPHLRAGYDKLFPPAMFETGDFKHLQALTDKPVILFSTSTCPYCRGAREYLRVRNIPYQDYVIDQSAQAQMLYDSIEGQGVPILVIGQRKIKGFHEEAIAEAVRIAGISQQ